RAQPRKPRRHRRPELLGEIPVRRGLLPAIGALATRTTVRVLPAALPRQREDPPAKSGALDRHWAPGGIPKPRPAGEKVGTRGRSACLYAGEPVYLVVRE